MFKTFLKGVNKQKLIITVFVVFAYIWVTDFIIHGFLLGSTYHATQHLWRSEVEMQQYMGWMILGQFLIAKFFTLLFVKGYEGKGMAEGVRFGLLIGPFSVAPCFIQYAVSPLPPVILWSWVGLGLLQALGGGVVAAATYKK